MADSWLIRDGMDRERMLDMDSRIEPLRRIALLLLGVCLALCVPWLGWWPLVVLVVAGAFFQIAHSRTEGSTRPENVLFTAWYGSVVLIAASVALTGGIESPAIGWFAIPVVTLSARFSTRGVTIGVVATLATLLAVVFAVDARAVFDDPPALLANIALVAGVAILSTALMQSDREHRTEAVIDPLTGLLNRHALASRVEELVQRSAVTSEPIGVIIADIDHFKRINDEHGHQVGDSVLKDLAYLLRKELRAFDLAYRIGGEEFLLLLPGADLEETREFAQRLHQAVGSGRRGGLRVTMSFGVSCSCYGDTFDYDSVFEAADAALYEAKNSGRNRVCVSTPRGPEDAVNGISPRIAV